jgi:tol-pal system beta propeller repeat protein TolB
MPAAERAALRGTIHAAAGREGAFHVTALDPTGATPPRVLTPPGAAYFPVPGPAPFAILTTDQGDVHTEQLVALGATPEEARPIGPRASHVRSPTVTPDGKTILFEADSTSFRDVYRLDVATDTVTRLTDNPEGNFEPSLSPDGTQVAFTSSRDGDSEVYAMPVAGGPVTRLTVSHRDDWLPAWSPDGAWIAFLSDREGVPRVFVVRPDGKDLRHAHAGEVVGEEQEPTWSPDGKRLAYTVSTNQGASEVWWADVAASEAHRVSAEGARDEVPSWSPDGAHLVYVSTRDQRIDLWIGRADGTAEARLTDTPEEEWIPRWRP